MSIEAISATAATELAAAPAFGAPQPAPGVFDTVLGSLSNLNSQLLSGENAVAQVALGNMDSLHRVAMSSEHTRLEFELMLSVRNKVLDAYQELMRMQV